MGRPSGSTKVLDKSVQSANVFFHCTDKLEYLTDIIKKRAFVPRYYEEDISYLYTPQDDYKCLYLKEHNKITFPMSCFCDIYISKLKSHMKNYGYFGIGLSKSWGVNNGLQPISYINSVSDFKVEFAEAVSNSLSSVFESKNVSKEIDLYTNQILVELAFKKPIFGTMKHDEEEKEMNFHDEREWRFIPTLDDSELPLIVPWDKMNRRAYDEYSSGMYNYEAGWLKFSFSDIKYLVVKNASSREKLIKFIMEESGMRKKDSYMMISKIINYRDIEGDL